MVATCSLERFLQAYTSCQFLHLVWRQFDVTVRVTGFLDTHSQFRLAHSCIVILSDRADVALAATEWRFGWSLTAWTVPTPPVAAWTRSDLSESDDEL